MPLGSALTPSSCALVANHAWLDCAYAPLLMMGQCLSFCSGVCRKTPVRDIAGKGTCMGRMLQETSSKIGIDVDGGRLMQTKV